MARTVLFILISLCCLHHSVQSTSNYIIDSDTNVPIPLDVCNSFDSYSVQYSCLNYTNLVFQFNFTTDIYCWSSYVMTPLYDLSSSNFNCIGDNNYVSEEYYQSEEDCDMAAYYYPNISKTVNVATDVCFYDKIQQKYAKYACTALFREIVYFDDYISCDDYTDDAVSNTSTSSSDIAFVEYSSSTLCNHHSDIDGFPFHALLSCVVHGIPETLYSESYIVDYYGLSMYHRMALIDFYISTTDYGHNVWDNNCTELYLLENVGITQWNLFALAIYGDLYLYDDYYPFCGLFTQLGFDGTVYIALATGNANLTGSIPSTLCYLQERLTYIRIPLAPNLYGTIPECIATYLFYLSYLAIADTSITGNIPSEIGNLAYIQVIYFADNPLMNATIPDSICAMMTGPYFSDFLLSNVGVYGTIPQCVLPDNYTHNAVSKLFTLEQTNINGTISDAWCDISDAHRLILQLIDNPYITGHIPSCLRPISMEIREMNGLSGTIPSGLFCNERLKGLIFENNTNFEPSRVPPCLSDDTDLVGLILYNSSFVGTFPVLPMNSSLQWINIAANAFEGSLTEIVDFSIDNVLYFMAHKNKFHDDNISDLLAYFWQETNVSMVSISDNPDIHGTMPDDIYNTDLERFLAHNCDLHGTLPQRSTFEALTIVTLYGNRLSGELPMDIYPVFNTSASIVLLHNLFSTADTDDLPNWINSPFSTAPNLYISRNRRKMGIFLIVMCHLGIFILFAHMIYDIIKSKTNLIANQTQKDDAFGFFGNIEFILKKMGNWKLLCCTVVLAIFYAFNANYYHTVTTESLFTLAWYHVHSTDRWLDWMLFVLVTLLQIVLTQMVLNLHLEQINDKYCKTLKQITIATQQQQKKSQQIDLYNQYSQKIRESQSKDHTKQNSAFEIQSVVDHMRMHTNNKKQLGMKYMWSRVLLIAVYFILYLFGITLVIIYVIARTLPEQNLLNLDATQSVIISQSIGLIMFINNRYIIRGMVNTIAQMSDFVYFYRAEFTLFLRMNNTIIVPLIASIFLLNDCGKYWIHLWDYCNDADLKSEFDFIADLADADLQDLCTQDCASNWQLLSSDDVCTNPSVSAMDANKCIRGFFYHWTFAILMKLIYTMFACVFGLFYRLLYLKYKKTKNKLYIEGYYTSIITSLVVSISFLSIAPLILALNILQIVLRTQLYRLMITKCGMELSSINTRKVKMHKTKQSLPVYFLWFGVIIGQCLVILFLRWCVHDIAIAVLFMLCISCMNIYCGVVIKTTKIRLRLTKEEHRERVKNESIQTMSSNQMYSVSVPSTKRTMVRSATSSPLSDVVADVGDAVPPSAFTFKFNEEGMIMEEPTLEQLSSELGLNDNAMVDASNGQKYCKDYIDSLHQTIETMQREMKKIKQDMQQMKVHSVVVEKDTKEGVGADEDEAISVEKNGDNAGNKMFLD